MIVVKTAVRTIYEYCFVMFSDDERVNYSNMGLDDNSCITGDEHLKVKSSDGPNEDNHELLTEVRMAFAKERRELKRAIASKQIENRRNEILCKQMERLIKQSCIKRSFMKRKCFWLRRQYVLAQRENAALRNDRIRQSISQSVETDLNCAHETSAQPNESTAWQTQVNPTEAPATKQSIEFEMKISNSMCANGVKTNENADGPNQTTENESSARGTHISPNVQSGEESYTTEFGSNHQKDQSEETYHVCNYLDCGKQFLRKDRFQSHERIHATDIRPYACEFPECGKRYTTKSNLRIHTRTHTGDLKT